MKIPYVTFALLSLMILHPCHSSFIPDVITYSHNFCQESKENKDSKDAKIKSKDIKEEKEDWENVKIKEESEFKETDKSKKKKDKKEKKEKKEKEKNSGPMHITANGQPVPLDEANELDKNHPLWDEVCLIFFNGSSFMLYVLGVA